MTIVFIQEGNLLTGFNVVLEKELEGIIDERKFEFSKFLTHFICIKSRIC